MNRYNRGSKVIIETIFYDTSMGIAQPTSANITISYPDGAVGSNWPFDGSEQQTTTIALTNTSTTDGTWATTWDSAVSAPGLIQWSAVPSDLTFGVNEGQFLLRGNLANPTAVATTL